jgi:hypothetical protein
MTADVVVQDVAHVPVAGSFGTGDGLGEQLCVASRVDGPAGVQVPHEAPGQHDVIAELPGALHRFLNVGKSPARLAGRVVSEEECADPSGTPDSRGTARSTSSPGL